MIIDLDGKYTVFYVIGAVNRALGDDHNWMRPLTKPNEVPVGAEQVEINVHERKPTDDHENREKGKIVYSVFFNVKPIHYSERPEFVKPEKITIIDIDGLEEKILKEL